MRRRYIQINGELVEVTKDYQNKRETPDILPDIEAYESPATGKIISSRSARREDLKRSGCREYEDPKWERENAARIRAEADREFERKVSETAIEVYRHMGETKQKQIAHLIEAFKR